MRHWRFPLSNHSALAAGVMHWEEGKECEGNLTLNLYKNKILGCWCNAGVMKDTGIPLNIFLGCLDLDLDLPGHHRYPRALVSPVRQGPAPDCVEVTLCFMEVCTSEFYLPLATRSSRKLLLASTPSFPVEYIRRHR